MQTKVAEKWFFFGLLLVTFIFTFFIFRPFWVVIVLGISFSIVLYPVHTWLRNMMPAWISALLTVILFTLALCGPLFGIGAIIFDQSQGLYHKLAGSGNIDPIIQSLDTVIDNLLPAGIDFDVSSKASEFVSYISRNVANIFSATLSVLFSFFLMLIIIFHFLKDGERWRQAIVALSPLNDKEDEKIIHRLTNSINAVIKGSLFIAIVQGLLMGIGLFIFGVPNAALWGVVASISSFLPTIGTALVSVPAIIFLATIGHYPETVGLALWAVFMVGMMDNFLSPMIVGGKINIPSLLILFSVLGGISFLGPIGILIGPLTLSLLHALISIYRNELKQNPQ